MMLEVVDVVWVDVIYANAGKAISFHLVSHMVPHTFLIAIDVIAVSGLNRRR